MHFLIRTLGFVVCILPFLLVALVFFSLQQQPLVENTLLLKHTDIVRAEEIIRNNDPRRLRKGQKKSVTISVEDLSIALNYLLNQFINGAIETNISDQTLQINGTAMLPDNLIGKYLNIKLDLIPEQQMPIIKRLSIGKITIPGIMLQELFSLYANSDHGSQLAAVTDMLQSVQIKDNELRLSYTWNPDSVKQVKDLIVTQQNQQTLIAYQNQLVKVAAGFSTAREYSFTVVLEPMFRFAKERSINNNPVAENRALITVLAAYIKGQSLRELTGTTGTWPKRLRLLLHDRYDFVQHFTFSAGLTVTGGSTLADAIGLYKEHEDSKGSSGFSFTDLAADRAGVRFAELATASVSSARQLQQRMSKQLTESVIMPKTSDLPENINATVFQSKFQNGNGVNYRKVVKLIEKRINALPMNGV